MEGAVKYPNVNVQLTGTDGNAFAVLGKMRKALKRGGATPEDVAKFTSEATAGDYYNLLAVCMDWVNVT